MAVTVAELQARLTADTRQFDRSMDRSGRGMSKFGSLAKGAALGAGAAVAYGLGKVAKIGWDEFNQGQKVAAQTNAVLKSTGAVANVTAKQVDDLAVSLMKKSGVDDEVIKSGENMLLTFTNIRNETGKGNAIFDRATKTMLDMSVALGQDTTQSAMQLGKALNDPVRGMTALRRVGVAFTEEQEKQIKTLVKNGDTMKAQKVILRELNKEFGGSAKAAGETLGGQINILRERFNNWAGDMVARAIPMLQRLAHWFKKEIVPALQDFWKSVQKAWPDIRKFLVALGTAARKMAPLWRIAIKVAGIAIRVYGKLLSLYAEGITRAIDVTQRFVRWIRGPLSSAFEFIRDKLALVRNTARFTWDFFRDRAQSVVDVVRRIIQGLRDFVEFVRSIPNRISGALGRVGGFFGGIIERIPGRGDFGSFGMGRTSLVALGQQLQSMGFHVGEHPAFGGVAPVHVPGSYHYKGRALDINWPGGGGAEMSRLDWLYSRLKSMPGITELLWRTAGHFDHLHVAMNRGGVVPGRRGAPVPVLAHGGETFIPTHLPGWRNGNVSVYLVNQGVLGSKREVMGWIRDAVNQSRRQTGGRSPF